MGRSKVQVLYDACCAIFSQEGLPTFQQIQYLKTLLDRIEAVDVGIDEFGTSDCSMSSPESGGSRGLLCAQAFPEITYIHIHECDHFSIGVFCFPAGKVFPLHDHPGMTVFSKVLYGSVHVKAYDWIKLDASGCPTYGDTGIVSAGGLASSVIDGITKAPREASILFPRSGGNIHSFTALTPCAILDVLSPPYSPDFGRPSTYFSHFPVPSLPGYAWLQEKPLPDDLIVKGAPYLGPPVATECDFCQCGLRNYV
ncbi:hypothetical protein QN277_017406 [Acacia crassicarpa]|uniref:cysteine dioxygenase n=1 Tax=Acacia crassicarpa TaxID=499986 RepID=A0AAE1JR47_9FABA|nr:hypothetical protein QN277_017406 [Acacia crassicarpa]